MPPLAEKLSPAAGCERRQLVAELFHALNQPLTTLRCALELALVQPRTAEQYQATLIHGLADAERVICLSGGIRELLESDDPGDNRQTVALDLYLAEGVLDLLPVAESAGVILAYTRGSTCSVFFEPRRLRQALFLLLEFALGSSRAGTAMNVQAAERDRDAMLLLTISPGPSTSPRSSPSNSCPGEAAPKPEARPLVRRLGLAIARGIFEAAGGDVRVESGENRLRIEVRLPLSAAFPGHAYPSGRMR